MRIYDHLALPGATPSPCLHTKGENICLTCGTTVLAVHQGWVLFSCLICITHHTTCMHSIYVYMGVHMQGKLHVHVTIQVDQPLPMLGCTLYSQTYQSGCLLWALLMVVPICSSSVYPHIKSDAECM